MKYVKATMSLEDKAKMEFLESKTAQQNQEIEELKETNDFIANCIMEMSEQVYQ